MNKRRGLALGTIVAASLLLRPIGSAGPQQSGSPKGDIGSSALAGLPSAEGDGPWVASCNYWAPMRKPDWSNEASEVNSAINAEGGGVDLRLQVQKASQGRNLGCLNQPGDRWGLPDSVDSLDVTAIVATVPDPVHTHLGMNFDRSVDALLQAAQDSGYVGSYYWLPWKNRQAWRASDPDGNTEPGHDAVREREPGLIILRYVAPKPDVSLSLENSFKKVIYLFLVAEVPTFGIEGFQFQRALFYENQLAAAITGHGSFARGMSGAAAIVGPQYSGSAASLRAAIETAGPRFGITEFEVAGTTATVPPAELLTLNSGAPLNAKLKISYYSFEDNNKYDHDILAARLQAANYDLQRTTLLIEDDTAYGVTFDDVYNSSLDHKSWREIRFPRDISLLRDAQATEDQYGADSARSPGFHSPYLRFSLKEPSPADSVPDFSHEHTPVSQEAQLMAIARELHRYRSQFIGIVATNPLDQVFLAQFLHRACPDARLLFFGSDLLMVREVDSVPFIGSITITPYPLMGLGGGSASRTYPSYSSQAYYNAVA
jgi:hypothetical protein